MEASPEPCSTPLVRLSFLIRIIADFSLLISMPVVWHHSSVMAKALFNFSRLTQVKAKSSA
jgi:hypothetical protein